MIPLNGNFNDFRVDPIFIVAANVISTDLINEQELSIHALNQIHRQTRNVIANRSDDTSNIFA